MQDRVDKIMTQVGDVDVAQLAVIECLRQIADGNKKTGQVLEGMQVELRDVRERIIRIEAAEYKMEMLEVRQGCEQLESRVELLEKEKFRREGAVSAYGWFLKSWPTVIALLSLMIVVLVANGKIHL